MTRLLEQAIAEIAKLPDTTQDAIAARLLADLAVNEPALEIAETALLSESVLAEDWLRPEADQARSTLSPFHPSAFILLPSALTSADTSPSNCLKFSVNMPASLRACAS